MIEEGHKSSEFTLDSTFVWVNILFVLTLLLSCGFLLAAAMTDPGIIPRKGSISTLDG